MAEDIERMFTIYHRSMQGITMFNQYTFDFNLVP